MEKAYISSTYDDLKEYREKVGIVVRTMGLLDVAMEYYIAEDQRPVDKCRSDVRTCDLYIGIFAWRYGWVPNGENPQRYSITRIEYEGAKKSGKKCFIYLLDGKFPWPPDITDDDRRMIRSFRDEVNAKHGGALFTSPDSLAAQVTASLSGWLLDKGTKALPPDFSKYLGFLANRY
jgi:Domain of unknown function (DUF4062)